MKKFLMTMIFVSLGLIGSVAKVEEMFIKNVRLRGVGLPSSNPTLSRCLRTLVKRNWPSDYYQRYHEEIPVFSGVLGPLQGPMMYATDPNNGDRIKRKSIEYYLSSQSSNTFPEFSLVIYNANPNDEFEIKIQKDTFERSLYTSAIKQIALVQSYKDYRASMKGEFSFKVDLSYCRNEIDYEP